MMSQRARTTAPRSVALVIAAILSWVPLTAIVASRVAWAGLPSTLTSHWNFLGAPDSRGTPGAVFWDFAPPAALLAFTVTALVISVGGDLSRRGGAVGIGLVSWFLGTITGIWFVLGLVAIDPTHTTSYVTMLIISGVLYGALVGGAIALPRPQSLDRELTNITREAP